MLAQILSDEIAKDVAGAETQVTRTADLKAEVDAREDRFVNIKSISEQLIKQVHFTNKRVMNLRQEMLLSFILSYKSLFVTQLNVP